MEFQKESIFTASVRAFCRMLFGGAGLLIGLLAVAFAAFMFFGSKGPIDQTDIMIAADADGNRELLPESAPVILRLNIHNVIGMGDLTGKNVELQLADSQGPVIKKGRVKGILLHINSPGGMVNDADQIYEALESYQKKYEVPVYAYVDGLSASGAVYISSSAEKIYASPVSVIGSVGVIMGPFFNVYDLMENYGVKALTLKKGKDKDMLSPFRPWQKGEENSLTDVIDYQYQRFVNIVTKARPQINRNKLVNEYGAQVFDAPKAEKLGYIDYGHSNYGQALTALQKKAGIEGPYQVIELLPPRPFFADLIEGHFMGIEKIKWLLDPNPMSKLMYLYNG